MQRKASALRYRERYLMRNEEQEKMIVEDENLVKISLGIYFWDTGFT